MSNKIIPMEVKPFREKNNIAIALAANDYFVPYMSALLQSIVENSSIIYNYDILVLTQDISDENKEILRSMTERENFLLRFLNPGSYIENYTFYIRGHFSIETYYRLVLHEVIPCYDKILYLDSDMIVQTDVAELYNEDIEGYLIAATYDADSAGLYNGYEKKKKAYIDNVLKLKKPYQYFQAGVLLINLEEFRNRFRIDEILQFAVSNRWELLDQDILNKLCEGGVKFIDMSWNVMVDYKNIRISNIISLAPENLKKMYKEARKAPGIIHYAGSEKPWYNPDMDFGMVFWDYICKTPYYGAVLHGLHASAEAKGKGSKLTKSIKKGFKCISDHGLGYTIKYMLVKRRKKGNKE